MDRRARAEPVGRAYSPDIPIERPLVGAPRPVARLAGRWGPPLLIIAAVCAMAAWTWGTWPDPVIDFGDQLYIPWQLSQGKVLYRDIAFYNGPLSQYVNSIWFRLFGVGLRTLVFCNLAIVGVLILVLHAVLRRVAGRWAALAGCLAFVLLFAFGGYTKVGNYNYVCPYSHEMTHGVLLSFLSLLGVWGYRRFGLYALAGGGVALGLSFLTKAEIFVGAAAASAVGVALTIWAERPARRRMLAMVASFAGGAILPPAVAWGLLCLAMPASRALAGTLGSWVVAVKSELVKHPFHRKITGLDDAGGNLALMLVYAGGYAAVLAPAAVVGLAVRRIGRRREVAAAGVYFLTTVLLLLLVSTITGWLQVARPLPLLMLLTAGAIFVRFLRARERDARRRALRRISLIILGLGLLSKMILRARIGHYGFVLAMPATLVLVALLLDWLPAGFSRLGGDGLVLAAAGAAMLLVGTAAYLAIQSMRLGEKTYEVGTGTADAFRCEPSGRYVDEFIRYFPSRALPGETLVVLPEGAMLNFLCRRESSVPYFHLLPVIEVGLYGEGTILKAFQAHPPDWIALTNRSTAEFGPHWFGRDYCVELGDWIDRHYQTEKVIGAPRFQEEDFGIVLLKRVP